ncbi:hypothetical protein ABZ826_05550 [Streptomyces sp. NPDC047515]|uniref:hypothetical protein n=1 Tax=Streptomyces sp. NPDC047515 TaxID=3155380 RepID=UPI0033ED524D
MTPARHTAKALATAAVLVLTTVLACCGTQRAGDAGPGAGSSGPPSAGPATPYVEPGADDGAPHYRENHAFQSTAELSPADRARGEAAVKKVEAGLAGIAEGRRTTESQLHEALAGLGYSPESISTGTFGPHRTTFIVELGPICVEGALDGLVNGLVTAEAHGRYLEGTGCVKPVGGH